MTNVLLSDTLANGQQITIYKNGAIMFESGQGNVPFLIFDLDRLVHMIGLAYQMVDKQKSLAEMLGLAVPTGQVNGRDALVEIPMQILLTNHRVPYTFLMPLCFPCWKMTWDEDP